ncbi:glutathione peroxidase 7-like [Oscarella lobularis]|uniref:glutathione peroxidase 7-like n=1 Tax=Oscarella lobularis TaxID=121494 RepID=UPI0032507FEE
MLRRVFILSCLLTLVAGNFYTFSARDIDGETKHLADYAGKVSLVVNVASECGYTESNYRDLVALQKQYKSFGFNVLAFPCNQFGEQEPETEANIKSLLKRSYHVNFPLFSKIDVMGPDAHPVYEYLYEETGKRPTWNFAKYLINRSGKVVQFFDTKIQTIDIRQQIERLMKYKDEF